MLAAPLANSILVRDAIARSAVSGPSSYPVESTTLPHVRTMPAGAGVPPPAAAGPLPEPHPAVMQDPASDRHQRDRGPDGHDCPLSGRCLDGAEQVLLRPVPDRVLTDAVDTAGRAPGGAHRPVVGVAGIAGLVGAQHDEPRGGAPRVEPDVIDLAWMFADAAVGVGDRPDRHRAAAGQRDDAGLPVAAEAGALPSRWLSSQAVSAAPCGGAAGAVSSRPSPPR